MECSVVMFGRNQYQNPKTPRGVPEAHISMNDVEMFVQLVAYLEPEHYTDDRIKDAITTAQRLIQTGQCVLVVDS